MGGGKFQHVVQEQERRRIKKSGAPVVGGTVKFVCDLVSYQAQKMDILGNPHLKIFSGDHKYHAFCQCFDRYGCERFFRKNRNFTNKINGLVFFDHKYISIFKFIDYPVISAAYDPEIIQRIVFLMDDSSRWKFPDGVAGFQFFRHIFEISFYLRIGFDQFFQCHFFPPTKQ